MPAIVTAEVKRARRNLNGARIADQKRSTHRANRHRVRQAIRSGAEDIAPSRKTMLTGWEVD